MKKFFLLACLCSLSLVSFAQEEKPESNRPASPEISALQTAAGLAKYGYTNYSASALVEAAKIFAETKTQPLDVEAEHGRTESVTEKSNPVSFEPAQLLADAKKFAGKDKAILAYIKRVEKSIVSGSTRGAVGGPKATKEIVLGKDVDSYKIKKAIQITPTNVLSAGSLLGPELSLSRL